MALIAKHYRWVPQVYIMQGIPFGLVALIAPLFYKNVGWDNIQIAGYTSLLTLPWLLKFLLAPMLENIATKRTFVWVTQFFVAFFTLLLAINLFYISWIGISLILFSLIALSAAIHDLHSDGLYLESLDSAAQTYFIGIRSLFYQAGKFLSQGGLVILIGYLSSVFNKETAWQLALLLLAVILFFITWYNYLFLPKHSNNSPINHSIAGSYKNILAEFKKIPHYLSGILFIFLYHFPESQIIKIFPLYLLDQQFSIEQIGWISGIVSLTGMLLGITLSGLLLKRFTLKKCLLLFTLFTACANIGYLWLVNFQIDSLWIISSVVIVAQFFFGLSNGAYMLYIIHFFAKSKHYSMSLYAIGTTIMLAGVIVSGCLSGYLQEWLGYTGFFVWITTSGVGVIALAYYSRKYIS